MTHEPRLTRTTRPSRPPAAVRIVHLGLGAFHRSHQAWYTDRVDETREWGIAAFTGRRADAARTLAAQNGLYTLIERAETADRFTVVESITEARDIHDRDRLHELVARADTSVITLTLTEAGYGPEPSGAIARLVDALEARRRAGTGALAIVCCDNLPANGNATRDAVLAVADRVDASLAAWIDETLSFVSTSVDRITPRTTGADIDLVARQTGYADEAVVVAEPFSSWVLSGDFPAGRPAWEHAGALFVDDIEPFEQRKLWLLNGAHSLLAYAGLLRGYGTVAEAIADPALLAQVQLLWDVAAENLEAGGGAASLDLDRYRAALLVRFRNPRIEHRLAQIATASSADGAAKLRIRVVPLVLAERRAGRSGEAPLCAVAAWLDYSAGLEHTGSDAELLASLNPSWPTDAALGTVIHRLRTSATATPVPSPTPARTPTRKDPR